MPSVQVATHSGMKSATAWYLENGLAVQRALYVKGYHVIHLESGMALEARAFSTRKRAREYQEALLKLPIDWHVPGDMIVTNEEWRNAISTVHNQYR